MDKGHIFEFITPNGRKVRALCLECITIKGIGPDELSGSINICYAQERLFSIMEDSTQYQLISNWVSPIAWDHILDDGGFFTSKDVE